MWQLLAGCFGASKAPVAEQTLAPGVTKAAGNQSSGIHPAAVPAGDATAAIHTQGAKQPKPKSVKWAASGEGDEEGDEVVSQPSSKDGIDAHTSPPSSADSNTDGSVLVDANEYSAHSRSLAAHRNSSSHSSGSNGSSSGRRRSALGKPEGDSAAQERQQLQQGQQGQQGQHEHNSVPGTLSCESSGYMDVCEARMEDSMRELQRVVSRTSELAQSFKSRQSSGGGSLRGSIARRSSGNSRHSSAGGVARASTGGFMQEPVQRPAQQQVAAVQAAAAAATQGTAVLPFGEE